MRAKPGLPSFMDLPQEVRLQMYDSYMLQPSPNSYGGIESPPPRVRKLWLINKTIRDEVRTHRARAAFMTNTFNFRTPAVLNVFLRRTKWITHARIQRAHLKSITTDFVHFGLFSLTANIRNGFDGRGLSGLAMLPNLRELSIKTRNLELVPLAMQGAAWMQTPQGERDARYQTLMQLVMNALPDLPSGLLLRVHGTVPDRHSRPFKRDLHRWDEVRVVLSARCRGHAGWFAETIREESPSTIGQGDPERRWG
ncbi:hypothetical protein LTR36_005016 [Oleoguttula mirabilis]|uniref:Uncharacterized protein n=1 Tax=Oleoguttula mirabilis TaxID=1507867 RepID=A0AAV9JYK2_9PEZI|nr:hypothetical protein LTR36_005016 [Oleoguttula mirabilis]